MYMTMQTFNAEAEKSGAYQYGGDQHVSSVWVTLREADRRHSGSQSVTLTWYTNEVGLEALDTLIAALIEARATIEREMLSKQEAVADGMECPF